MPYRVFNIDEVARYLHLDRPAIDRLLHDQDIPFERQGRRVVFRKVEVDAWASRRILGLEGSRLAEYHQKSTAGTREVLSQPLLIPQLMDERFIAPDLDARTKASVIRELAALADRTGRVTDAAALLEGIRQREDLCSTGLPGGWALLHTHYPEPYVIDKPLVILGRTVQQIPFGAPDGQPTDLFFLLGCPNPSLHLHTLARLCLLARKTNVLHQLRLLSTGPEMYQALLDAEKSIIPNA
jgi:excisionase family DNA binding protein